METIKCTHTLREKSSNTIKKYDAPEQEGILYGPCTSQWTNSNSSSTLLKIIGNEVLVYLDLKQTSQGGKSFKVVLLIAKSEIVDKTDGDGCPTRQCHKLAKESGDIADETRPSVVSFLSQFSPPYCSPTPITVLESWALWCRLKATSDKINRVRLRVVILHHRFYAFILNNQRVDFSKKRNWILHHHIRTRRGISIVKSHKKLMHAFFLPILSKHALVQKGKLIPIFSFTDTGFTLDIK